MDCYLLYFKLLVSADQRNNGGVFHGFIECSE